MTWKCFFHILPRRASTGHWWNPHKKGLITWSINLFFGDNLWIWGVLILKCHHCMTQRQAYRKVVTDKQYKPITSCITLYCLEISFHAAFVFYCYCYFYYYPWIIIIKAFSNHIFYKGQKLCWNKMIIHGQLYAYKTKHWYNFNICMDN